MYVIKYSGPFGFIKPWTAVRDGETFSQQFLTPSIIKGIELKLFPELLKNNTNDFKIERILKHRLSFKSISMQQEQIQPRAYSKKGKIAIRPKAILNRGLMIEPVLHLAFNEYEHASIASIQHICLCRNEDILLPEEEILEMSETEFNNIEGFELLFEQNSESFLVGFNRFDSAQPMYGNIQIIGDPTRIEIIE